MQNAKLKMQKRLIVAAKNLHFAFFIFINTTYAVGVFCPSPCPLPAYGEGE
jgi:hypothetical protein